MLEGVQVETTLSEIDIFVASTNIKFSYKPSGLYMSLRCPVLSGGSLRSDLHTTTVATIRQKLFDFAGRVLLVTVLGKFYYSVPLKSWRSFPLVVLTQRTVLVLLAVFSARVVHVRVVQRRLSRGFGLRVWQQMTDFLFEKQFGRFIPRKPMDAKMIMGAELRNTVQRWSSRAAAGADSWKRCEWKQFTNTLFDQVAEYLNIIEETTGEMSYKELIETPMWPEEAESPGVRPITLAATLYCAWSSTRYRDAMEWAKREWLHKTVHGVPGARVQNAIWPLLLKMEAMTKDEREEGIATAAIDSEKYFDCTCWEVTFHTLDKMGLDQRIWKPMLNFIVHLKRFNKIAGTMGPTWTCTNSVIQGCSLSLLATAALSTVCESAGDGSSCNPLQQHCG